MTTQVNSAGTTEKSSTTPAVSAYNGLKTCHSDPHKGLPDYPLLWLSSGYAADLMAKAGVDVLMPLSPYSVDDDVWKTGWRGELLYVPCADYKILPHDVLKKYAKRAIALMKKGKTVGVCCVGGHGRTGYMASAIIGLMDKNIDPIAYLREHYCSKAVEAKEQIKALEILLGKDFSKHEPAKVVYAYGHGVYGGYYDSYAGYGTKTKSVVTYHPDTCYYCGHVDIATRRCEMTNYVVSLSAPKCRKFIHFQAYVAAKDKPDRVYSKSELELSEKSKGSTCGECDMYLFGYDMCNTYGTYQSAHDEACVSFEPLTDEVHDEVPKVKRCSLCVHFKKSKGDTDKGRCVELDMVAFSGHTACKDFKIRDTTSKRCINCEKFNAHTSYCSQYGCATEPTAWACAVYKQKGGE